MGRRAAQQTRKDEELVGGRPTPMVLKGAVPKPDNKLLIGQPESLPFLPPQSPFSQNIKASPLNQPGADRLSALWRLC